MAGNIVLNKVITKGSIMWMLPVLAALVVVPLLLTVDYYVFIMALFGIYVIVAIGFNIMSGYTGLISIGHAGFFAIGAYTATILVDRNIVPFLLAFPIAALVSAGVGYLLALPCLRLYGMYIAMATLAFGFIIEEVVLQLNSITGGHQGLAVPVATIGGYDSGIQLDTDKKIYFFILIVALALIFLAINIVRTKYGRAFIAIRESEIAASAMGVDLTKYKTMSFAISAFYTGVAGVLYAFLLHYIAPNAFNVFLSFQFLIMIVVGGFASVAGSIMGAIFITALPEFMSDLQEYQIIVYGLILMFFILVIPYGLAGIIMKVRYNRALKSMASAQEESS
jgi:branched-chain amino acid transport system permease protein